MKDKSNKYLDEIRKYSKLYLLTPRKITLEELNYIYDSCVKGNQPVIPYAYENRIVAFIDLLEFSNMVLNSVDNNEKYKQIKNIIT